MRIKLSVIISALLAFCGFAEAQTPVDTVFSPAVIYSGMPPTYEIAGISVNGADNYEDYVIFMNEMGVEIVQRWARWVYLRKRAEDGPFEVYTDTESKLDLYRRIRALFLWGLVIEACCSVTGISTLIRFPEDIFFRCLAGLYIVIVALFLRAVLQCTRKIRELEREGQ